MKTIAERTRALVQRGQDYSLPELTKLVEALTKTEEKNCGDEGGNRPGAPG